MSNENSQVEMPGIQLRESRTQPRVSLSREIGEAQITHTIFGKAKVRIIRKGDQARRYMMLAAIVVAVLAAAAWHGWLTFPQTGPEQSTAPAADTEVQASVPPPQPENVALPAAPSPVKVETVTPPATGINPPAASRKVVSPQPRDLQGEEQKVAKPLKAQPRLAPIKSNPVPAAPLMTGKPQIAPTAANKDVLKNQTEMPQPARVLPAKRPATPAATTPAPSAASNPAAVVPLGKDDITIQPPVGDSQLSPPINAPGK